jgi:hypothetical protein
MKLVTVAAFLMLCLNGHSQTTNWVTPGPYLRIVNGQLYNTYYSKKWDLIWRAAQPSIEPYSEISEGDPIGVVVEVQKILPDKIACDVFQTEYENERYSGQPSLISKKFIKNIIIYNYPSQSNLISGQQISGMGIPLEKDVRCIRVKNYTQNNQSYEAFDCGVQDTKPIPVVKR